MSKERPAVGFGGSYKRQRKPSLHDALELEKSAPVLKKPTREGSEKKFGSFGAPMGSFGQPAARGKPSFGSGLRARSVGDSGALQPASNDHSVSQSAGGPSSPTRAGAKAGVRVQSHTGFDPYPERVRSADTRNQYVQQKREEAPEKQHNKHRSHMGHEVREQPKTDHRNHHSTGQAGSNFPAPAVTAQKESYDYNHLDISNPAMRDRNSVIEDGAPRFFKGQRVKVRNNEHNAWKFGVVVTLHPLRVKPNHLEDSYPWNFVEAVESAPQVQNQDKLNYDKLHSVITEKLNEKIAEQRSAQEEKAQSEEVEPKDDDRDEWEFEEPPAKSTEQEYEYALFKLLRTLDVNGNGKLSVDELQNIYPRMTRRSLDVLVKMFDKNKDEELDFSELHEYWPTVESVNNAQILADKYVDDMRKKEQDRQAAERRVLEETIKKRDEAQGVEREREPERDASPVRRQNKELENLRREKERLEAERKRFQEEKARLERERLESQRKEREDAQRQAEERLEHERQLMQRQLEEQKRKLEAFEQQQIKMQQERQQKEEAERKKREEEERRKREQELRREEEEEKQEDKLSPLGKDDQVQKRRHQDSVLLVDVDKKGFMNHRKFFQRDEEVGKAFQEKENQILDLQKQLDALQKQVQAKKEPQKEEVVQVFVTSTPPEYENTKENWEKVVKESEATLQEFPNDDGQPMSPKSPKKRPSRLKRQTSKVALLLANLENQISQEFNSLNDLSKKSPPEEAVADEPVRAPDMRANMRHRQRRMSKAEEIIQATLSRESSMTILNKDSPKDSPRTKTPRGHVRKESAPQMFTLTDQLTNSKRQASKYKSEKRRCLAVMAPESMASTVKAFMASHKETLKHFRITGSRMVMKIVQDVFIDDTNVILGPTCSSSILGGDAQIAAQLMLEDLGGIIAFADPLRSKPPDVVSLLRLADIYNLMVASNPTSAEMCMKVLSLGVNDPSLIPSFHNTLENPCVNEHIKNAPHVFE